jgi:serine/threonine protein kinase
MNPDRTQPQSTAERERSQSLSRKRSQPPIEIPGYSIRQFLGAGAYGEVWVALDTDTGRKVAIKFYTHRGGLDWSLLSAEVEKLVFLSADRYVVQLLAVGWESDPPYYVMEYIENGSLEGHLAEQGPMAVGAAVEMFREVATGLLHAHGKGVLHCDLKPANILLDQEHKPRLADFGQSRLSHEQTPALGTLFYMAPEQASLKAIPDARWDVYALGALLYCMLTGEAPHRSDDAVSEIDSVDDLEQRLRRYQEFIRNGPQPAAHRQVKGIDRALAEIVDHCLAVDPGQRFSNVQSVLDSLRMRDSIRDRRPLLILGLLGPLLFLLIAAFSGWRGYDRAVREANQLGFERSVKGNGFAADFVSEAVARRIEGYFRSVEELAGEPEIIDLVQALSADPEISDLLQMIAARNADEPAVVKLQQQMFDHELQKQLQAKLVRRLSVIRQPEIASWFITDARGNHLAAVFDSSSTENSVGRNFAYRSYFTGADDDLAEHSIQNPPLHIASTHLSAVFQSTVDSKWKVAVSTPIWKDKDKTEFGGIAALTVELGQLGELLRSDKSSQHFNVLVVDRNKSGIILQHPLFEQILKKVPKLPSEFSMSPEYRVPLDKWNESQFYEDPLSRHPEGADYQHRWVAAMRPVLLESTKGNGTESRAVDTGLLVIVQENYDEVAQPIHKLGAWLMRLGLIAFTFALAVVLLLWGLVVRTLRNPDERIRRQGGNRTNPVPLHSLETVELPARLRRPPRE